MQKRLSVIVPVFNGEKLVAACIESLLSQTYDNGLLEIFVVDNGSTDHTREIVQKYNVQYLYVKNGNAYTARNLGLSEANGEIIAFIDADCIADPHWIEHAVRTIESKNFDLVGGRIAPKFTSTRSPSEWACAATYCRHDISIPQRNVAFGGNLFVLKKVIEVVGNFDDSGNSGGDVAFTKLAALRGFKLGYAPDAVVSHPTMRFSEIMRKSFRVGRGKGHLGIQKDASSISDILSRPHIQNLNPVVLREALRELHAPKGPIFFVLVYCNAVCIFTVLILGLIKGKIGKYSKKSS